MTSTPDPGSAAPAEARPTLWTRLFTATTVSNFGTALIFYMLTSTISGWAIQELRATPAEAGLLGTMWFLGAMVSRLFSGWLMTTAGERVTVMSSVSALLAGTLLYPFCDSVALLMALRLVHGMAFGCTATALGGSALSRVPASRRGEGTAWFSFGLAAASGLAPFVGTMIQQGPFGQTGVFVAGIICGLIAVAGPLSVFGRLQKRQPRSAAQGTGLASLIEVKALLIALIVALCALPFGSLLTLVNSYAASIGLADAVVFYFLVYSVVIFVSRPAAGMLQDRYGDTSVTVPIISALIVGVVLTATATNAWMLLGGAAMLGLGYGTLISAGQTIALNLAGSARASVAISTYFLLVDAGTGLGPFVIGAFVEPVGYRYALLISAAIACVGLLGMIALKIRLARTR